MTLPKKQLSEIQSALNRLKERMEKSIRGKSEVIDNVLVCLLGGGHLLLEDLPGMGKTTLAYALARALDGSFRRIQFTSDLLPADVLGVSVFNEQKREFEFKRGPVFANFILADEINRTTPKTQSALLEVMDRGRVSIDGTTQEVGEPFMVFATQNPVDYEGTFPLPDSQMDRFFMRLEMGYPDHKDELEIIRTGNRHYDDITGEPVVALAEVLVWQKLVPHVFVEETILEYILKLITCSRTESTFQCGISPRGALSLKVSSQAHALYHGREFVIPKDVEKMLIPVCGHRLKTTSHGSDPLEERRRVESVLSHILDSVPIPR